MSFLKFWGKKGKKDEADGKRDEAAIDPELEKRRLKHSLSISRSGRFKQRKRERGQILDKPELFNGQDGSAQGGEDESTSSQNSHHSPAHIVRPAHQRSPTNTCRDVNTKMAAGNIRMGPSVVT